MKTGIYAAILFLEHFLVKRRFQKELHIHPFEIILYLFYLLLSARVRHGDILSFLMFLLFYFMSLMDLFTREVYSICNYAIALIAILKYLIHPIPYQSILIGAILPVLLTLINRQWKEVIGDGDIELLYCVLPLLGKEVFFAFQIAYLLAGFYFLPLLVLHKEVEDEIAMIPFLSIGILWVFLS